MKKAIYVSDVLSRKIASSPVTLLGWISGKRVSKNYLFLDFVDSTGTIQIVCDKQQFNPNSYKPEQSLKVIGKIVENSSQQGLEVFAESLEVLGDVKRVLAPSPRTNFNAFDSNFTNYIQENRHLFLRNPQIMAALQARSLVLRAVHNWFFQHGFWEITAPILTPVLLYSEDTGIKADVNGHEVFLTQCVGFYLESAVHAFEKVYNIGPSFRGKESISKRHLTEYWHIKAEYAFCPFEDFFGVVEDLVSSVTRELEPFSEKICPLLKTGGFCNDALKIPFPRITYREAVNLLRSNGFDVAFGQSINDIGENFLSDYFQSPVWVTYNARNIEGFPYTIVEDDPELTYTADLIASRGFGEILGIADKIQDYSQLELRLKEKDKDSQKEYEWFKELRNYGTVQHCGLGMGVERLVRWLFQLPHVREAMPFPRSMGRRIYP